MARIRIVPFSVLVLFLYSLGCSPDTTQSFDKEGPAAGDIRTPGDAAGQPVEEPAEAPDDWEDEEMKTVRKAAEKGDPRAQLRLASMYKDGEDLVKAEHWFRKAADQGALPALKELANMHPDSDYPLKVADGYRKAAEDGDAWTQVQLGLMFSRGDGVPRDLVEAGKWYRRAMEHGDADAMHELRRVYELREERPKDRYERRRQLTRIRSKQEKVSAGLAVLAKMYELGRGVPQDDEQAKALVELAKEMGGGKVVNIITIEEQEAAEGKLRELAPTE